MQNTFAERLKLALRYRGFKRSELASKLKVDKSLITKYTSGCCEPKTRALFTIADLLEVNPKWLIGYDVPMCEDKK